MNEKKIPLIHSYGPLPDLISPIQFMFNPEGLFEKVKNLNSEIFSFRMVYEPWIFLTGKEGLLFFAQLTINDVDPFEFRKRMFTLHLPEIGIPNNLPETTLATNAILKSCFDNLGEANLVDGFIEEINNFLNTHLKNEGIIENFSRFTIDLITQAVATTFLGKELSASLPKDLGEVYADIDESLKLSTLFMPFIPRKISQREETAKRKLVQYLADLLAARKKSNLPANTSHFFDGYVKLQEELHLSDNHIIWLFNSMQWAAVHYSSVHAIWLGLEILSRPNLLKDLLEEQAQFNTLDSESIKKMQLLKGTVRESIRLNAIFALPRRVQKNLNFKGYEIPKGAIVSISPYLEHQNPAIYVNPDKFDPYRWDEWADDAMYTAFMPGGIGIFGCKGMPIAIHLLTAFWAVLLRNYQLALLTPLPTNKKQPVLLLPTKMVSIRYRRLTNS